MILSDGDIDRRYVHVGVEHLEIKPFYPHRVQPASYDVSLGDQFRYFRKGAHTAIDPRKETSELTKLRKLHEGETYILHPGDLVLGATVEYFEIPPDLCARVEGKSSLGRVGLVIHSTAGFIDPGFKGNITLEMSNNAPLPIVLTPGMLIGQIAFQKLTNKAERPYGSEGLGSHYQGDREPTEGKTVQGYPVRTDHDSHLGAIDETQGANLGWDGATTAEERKRETQEFMGRHGWIPGGE